MLDAAKVFVRRVKTTVILFESHVAALDHLAVTIRLRSGVKLSRASIICAFIAASVESPAALVERLLSTSEFR